MEPKVLEIHSSLEDILLIKIKLKKQYEKNNNNFDSVVY